MIKPSRINLVLTMVSAVLMGASSVHAQTYDGEWRGSGGCGIGNIDRYTITLSVQNTNVAGTASSFGQKSGSLPDGFTFRGQIDPANGSIALNESTNAKSRYDGKVSGRQITLRGWSGTMACQYTLAYVGSPQVAAAPPTPQSVAPTSQHRGSPTPQRPAHSAPMPTSQPPAEPMKPNPPVNSERDAFIARGAQEITAVQRALAALGYYRGDPDGVYGPGTAGAIEAWQRSQQLPLTGYLAVVESDRLKNQALAMLGGPSASPKVAATSPASTSAVTPSPPAQNAPPPPPTSVSPPPAAPATPAPTTALSSVHAAIGYGSRAGMEVSVISMEGRDTARAIIRTKHTRENAMAFCRNYVQKLSEECIQQVLATPLRSAVTANCQTGEFTDFSGARYRFLGLNKNSGNSYGAKYAIVSVTTRQVADGSSASGYPVNLAIYRALCPAHAPIDIDATVVSTSGRDTDNAAIRVRFTRENGRQGCEDNAGKLNEQCARQELNKRLDILEGNCATGEVKDFYGVRYRLVPMPKATYPDASYTFQNLASGETFDNSADAMDAARRIWATMSIYRALCPAHSPLGE